MLRVLLEGMLLDDRGMHFDARKIEIPYGCSLQVGDNVLELTARLPEGWDKMDFFPDNVSTLMMASIPIHLREFKINYESDISSIYNLLTEDRRLFVCKDYLDSLKGEVPKSYNASRIADFLCEIKEVGGFEKLYSKLKESS